MNKILFGECFPFLYWYIMPVKQPSGFHHATVQRYEQYDANSMCSVPDLCINAHVHTYMYTPASMTNKFMNFSSKKDLTFSVRTLLMSVFVSFDITLSSCLHWLQADESQWYTFRGPIHVCSPRDTHWVHCGEECLLSWPEPACKSTSIIQSQWVLHDAAVTIRILHSHKEKWQLMV